MCWANLACECESRDGGGLSCLQHDVKLLERADIPWYFSRGHEFDSHCGRSLFR